MSTVIKGSASGQINLNDTTGSIQLNGSDVLTFDSSGNVTVPNNLTVTGTPPSIAALSTASGSAPSYSARAWINFNGTGTVAIRGSANVSSLTDNGTGDYRINLTTAMADTNYSVVTSANEFATYFNGGLRNSMCYIVSTSVCGLACNYVNGSSSDVEIACLAVFR